MEDKCLYMLWFILVDTEPAIGIMLQVNKNIIGA